MKWIRDNMPVIVITALALAMLAFIVLEGGENDAEQVVTLGGNMMADVDSNPMKEMTGAAGLASVIWLIVSLAGTPLNTILGWRTALKLRKPAGLYAFGFALFHIILYFGGYSEFQLGEGFGLILAETRLWLGLFAFALMIPLAVTSNQWSQKQLGKKWKQLHRLVYVTAILVGIHVAMLEGALVMLGIIAVLLFLRIPAVRQRVSAGKYRREKLA